MFLHSFPEICGAQNPSGPTKNNSQGVIFVILVIGGNVFCGLLSFSPPQKSKKVCHATPADAFTGDWLDIYEDDIAKVKATDPAAMSEAIVTMTSIGQKLRATFLPGPQG